MPSPLKSQLLPSQFAERGGAGANETGKARSGDDEVNSPRHRQLSV